MNLAFLTPDDPAWQQALTSMEHDFYDFPGYLRLSARYEGGTPLAFFAEDGDRSLLLPLLIRPIDPPLSGSQRPLADASSPYGYPGLIQTPAGLEEEGFTHEALTAFCRLLRERSIVACFVRLHPLLAVPLAALSRVGQLVHHGDTISIDLTQPEAERWRQLRKNHRQQITHARRDGHTVQIEDTWDELETFVSIYQETMSRLHAAPFYMFSLEYFRELRAQLGDCAHLAFTRIDGKCAAAALFTEVCGIVQCHLAGSRDEYLKHSPLKIMIHSLGDWFRARGNHSLHLGGGVGGEEDELFHFKSGFSSRRHPFYTWRVIADERCYRDLVERNAGARRILDSEARGYFPGYRQPFQWAGCRP